MAKIRVFILPTENGKICVNADNERDAQNLKDNGAVELSEETVAEVFGDNAAYASPETVRFDDHDKIIFKRSLTQDYAFEINDLKRFLSETDYAIIKIAEGSATPQDYADLIEKRKAARNRINELEALTNEQVESAGN